MRRKREAAAGEGMGHYGVRPLLRQEGLILRRWGVGVRWEESPALTGQCSVPVSRLGTLGNTKQY